MTQIPDAPSKIQGVLLGKNRKILRRMQRLMLFFQPVLQKLMVEITMLVILNMMN